jgi:hypothetical protein
MKMPVNWFDLVILITLLVGVQRGRKRGMSEELMTLLRWVTLVTVGGMLYLSIGKMIEAQTMFSHLSAYLIAYLSLALCVAVIFSLLKRAIGGKLVGSDVFGQGEYYLAMPAGMIRFACMLIFGLALLNARLYSQAEIKAWDAYQKDVYGSSFFPTLNVVQRQVFEDSFTGPYIRQYLGFLLKIGRAHV